MKDEVGGRRPEVSSLKSEGPPCPSSVLAWNPNPTPPADFQLFPVTTSPIAPRPNRIRVEVALAGALRNR